ncbi:MAG: prolipoprotein diacylglyceryl transferase family protein, partial [Ktedonobacteraceae bacterium]
MNILLRDFGNNNLDKLVRPYMRLFHRSWPTFQVCGYTGLALAILLSMTLVIYQHLSPFIMLCIILAAVLTFFAQTIITKIITGEEDLVYYRHEIAVITVAAVLLWLLHQPLLPYLDATLLGVGIFLACGRVGCLMVGCCHGRPYHWGVCYREEHTAIGFPSYYVGVRFFPIQALESLWVFSIVLVGTFFVLSSHPAGTALAWYIVTYDMGRFCFEFVRGDRERPYLWGFSEAQWASLLLMCVIALAEVFGVLVLYPWHIAATACLICTMIIVALDRRFRRTVSHQLLHPHHIQEVAEAVELVTQAASEMSLNSGQEAGIHVACTSLGIQISASRMSNETGFIHHYALSRLDGGLNEKTACILTRLIQIGRA